MFVEESEIIDLENPSSNCQSWPSFKNGTYGAFGGLIRDTFVLLCGGYTSNEFSSKCVKLGPNTYEEVYTHDVPAYKSGAAVIKDKLFITGGLDGCKNPLTKSIKFIQTIESFQILNTLIGLNL